ncbi:ADP-ribosyl-(dinitrogen reductase) hydrolase [Piscinibacter koreensis]|uniref:ADP-ribosyl-(Dinitrogen reductase) hydrolase n=1 Tax=Piscinibacter koreensis TaxID=2742824 RepID=A0A7Y6TY03_9BURK|nr:ADP-ribosyl-(dinitrogen reductase) hydrolase [Schlegelella koreensis]NUZ07622.1 ADP-ribosyl-(dinitrogen reductase) hydrolase [Schlegelella koreensis]
MKGLVVSAAIIAKLREKHQVSVREVEQCFENKCGTFLIDDREDCQTDPPTLWFIAPTNRDRLLQVVFVYRERNMYLKSAFEPTPEKIDRYNRLGR